MNISVATQFSTTPGPREKGEGDFSGELFLEKVLRPAFLIAKEKGEPLTLDLDGTEGYATSFLEAAFGGLAREFESKEIIEVLRFKSDDEPYLVDEIRRYIEEARMSKARTA